jgi:hypothetical protein
MKNMSGPPPIILWGGIFVVFLTIVILTVIVEFYFLVWQPTNQLFSTTPAIHSSATPAPALVTPSPALPTSTAPVLPTSPATQTPSPTSTVSPTPSPTIFFPVAGETYAIIHEPQDGADVPQKVTVKGQIWNMKKKQQAFLCVRSLSFEKKIWPQGMIIPDDNGAWEVLSTYQTPGYPYETFVVVTDNKRSADLLDNVQVRFYGIGELPPDTEIISLVYVYNRR